MGRFVRRDSFVVVVVVWCGVMAVVGTVVAAASSAFLLTAQVAAREDSAVAAVTSCTMIDTRQREGMDERRIYTNALATAPPNNAGSRSP